MRWLAIQIALQKLLLPKKMPYNGPTEDRLQKYSESLSHPTVTNNCQVYHLYPQENHQHNPLSNVPHSCSRSSGTKRPIHLDDMYFWPATWLCHNNMYKLSSLVLFFQTSTTEEEMISTIQSHTHLPKPSIPRASLSKLAKPRMDSNPPKSSLTAISR